MPHVQISVDYANWLEKSPNERAPSFGFADFVTAIRHAIGPEIRIENLVRARRADTFSVHSLAANYRSAINADVKSFQTAPSQRSFESRAPGPRSGGSVPVSSTPVSSAGGAGNSLAASISSSVIFEPIPV